MTPLLIIAATLAAFAVTVWLWQRAAGFTAQRPADYAGHSPQFDARVHLSGPILCEGVIYGPFGRVSSRFVAKMHGTWDGDTCILAEHFVYDSGADQLREWRLTLDNSGHLRAQADDVIGTGRGVICGPTVQMLYRLRLPAASGGHVLDVTDWMYLTPNGSIINRSQFRKFGIKVAELVATLRPAPDGQAQTPDPSANP
jgi:hypothetical protein